MSRYMSVASLCNTSHNLHLSGYSEEQIDELIQNGDLRGRQDPTTGMMMVEKSEMIDYLPSEFLSLKEGRVYN